MAKIEWYVSFLQEDMTDKCATLNGIIFGLFAKRRNY